MTYKLGLGSIKKLRDVHPDLVLVVLRAIQLSTVDFAVGEGIRTAERQRELYAQQKTKTLNSRHIPVVFAPTDDRLAAIALGHAVDLWPWVAGAVPWDDWTAFEAVAAAMKKAAGELGVAIRWGGDWETFKDGPHFELVVPR